MCSRIPVLEKNCERDGISAGVMQSNSLHQYSEGFSRGMRSF